VSVIVIIGLLTGNKLPPFAIRLIFGGLIDPFGLENAATYIRHKQIAVHGDVSMRDCLEMKIPYGVAKFKG